MNFFSQNKSPGKIITVLILVVGLIIILLVSIVKWQFLSFWDVTLVQRVQSQENGKLLVIMRWLSFFGDYPFAAFVLIGAAIFFIILGHLREALFIFLVPIADFFNFLIKILINRPRPPEELITVYQKLSDPSFPSGHVVHYVVFWGFIFTTMFTIKKLPVLIRLSIAFLSATLIIFISISRLFLGVHWPTDIIAGYLVGFFLLFLLLFFYFRQLKKAPFNF